MASRFLAGIASVSRKIAASFAGLKAWGLLTSKLIWITYLYIFTRGRHSLLTEAAIANPP